MITKISFPSLKQNRFTNKSTYVSKIDKNFFMRPLLCDSVCFGAKNKDIKQGDIFHKPIPDELKEELDKEIFVFKKANGEEFKGTIREYFNDSIIEWSEDRMYLLNPYFGGVYHNTYLENALSILNDGLDYTKTSRVMAGPGTYFSPCQDLSYGSVVLKGVYTGKMKEIPVFKERFYDGVLYNSCINKLVQKFANSDKESNQFLNKYCHDLLVNDFGIDVLYCAMKRQSCYVVLNDDTVSLSPYNFKVMNGRIVWC